MKYTLNVEIYLDTKKFKKLSVTVDSVGPLSVGDIKPLTYAQLNLKDTEYDKVLEEVWLRSGESHSPCADVILLDGTNHRNLDYAVQIKKK